MVKQPVHSKSRQPLLSPINIPYLVFNPLEIIYSNHPEGSQDRTLFISGLADKEIEDMINGRLSGLYSEVKDRDFPHFL